MMKVCEAGCGHISHSVFLLGGITLKGTHKGNKGKQLKMEHLTQRKHCSKHDGEF